MINSVKIIKYKSSFETGWVRCRVLSFLDSSFFDDVRTSKEKYNHPSIELIAIIEDKVIGFIDMEYETEPNMVCSKSTKMNTHLVQE